MPESPNTAVAFRSTGSAPRETGLERRERLIGLFQEMDRPCGAVRGGTRVFMHAFQRFMEGFQTFIRPFQTLTGLFQNVDRVAVSVIRGFQTDGAVFRGPRAVWWGAGYGLRRSGACSSRANPAYFICIEVYWSRPEVQVACRFLDILRVRVGYVGPLLRLLTVSEQISTEADDPRSRRRVSPF